MGKNVYIRVWKELELFDMQKHLLIVGDLMGDCSNCKEVGLDISAVKTCPKCNTEFKYIASRAQGSSQGKRLKTRRPDLIAIEFADFKEAQTRDEARKFLE